MKTSSTRIHDIKPQNRVKKITKTASGALLVEQYSGAIFEISKDDPEFQTFAVYAVLYEL